MNPNSEPQLLLSVIVPVFNGRKYLRSTLQSLFDEKMPSTEVIVVDDGSDDDCLETVSDFPIKKIRLPANRGQAHAQNIGVQSARGQLIAFLDADDLLAANGLRWRCKWLIKHPEKLLVAGCVAGIIDGRGEYLGSYAEILNPGYRTPPSVLTEPYLKSGGEFPSQSWLFMFRRTLLQSVGAFDESLYCAHDNDYFYRVLKKTAIPFVDLPVIFYRIHDANLSGKIKNGKFVLYSKHAAENLLVHLSHGILPKA